MTDILKQELLTWLDSQEITSGNIGNIRRKCLMPFDTAWNAFVRDETAARENKFDIWKDPMVQEALADGRPPEDIAVLCCPKCGLQGYYNQGSHFTCRKCGQIFDVLSEDEEPQESCCYVRIDDCITLADTVGQETGP
ncbi:MAG TPA: hypothetical protein VFU31_21035 [Candidatus Binatia bacterium]|nr:hypothetical protein [Candidatus Binatia bacterium]